MRAQDLQLSHQHLTGVKTLKGGTGAGSGHRPKHPTQEANAGGPLGLVLAWAIWQNLTNSKK